MTPQNSSSTLTPDQQKIAAATANIAASEAANGNGEGEVKIVVPPKVARIKFTEPPKELMDKGEFKLNSDDDILEVEKAPITTPPVTQPKPSERSEAKPTTPPTTKVVEQPKATTVPAKTTTTTQPTTTDGRDYTGYTPEEVETLKQMSNPAFNYTVGKLKQLKELEGKVKAGNEVYYQHPQGFMLTPEYNQAITDYQYADFEANHWKKQLLEVKAGRPWTPLTGYDKNGNPVYGQPIKATEDGEISVQDAYNGSLGISNQLKGKLQEMQTGFKTKVDADLQAMQNERANRFAWVKDPKVLDETINIPEVGDVKISQVRQDFKNLFPSYQHSNPLLDVAADLFVAVQKVAEENRKLSQSVTTEKKLKQEVIDAEPTVAEGQIGTGGGKAEPVFDLVGLPT